MPIIVNPEDMKAIRRSDDWTEITLADAKMIGAPAMVARRYSLKPNTQGPEIVHGDAEGLLYVISGSGTVLVGDERLPLEHESVLWLERGDRYRLEAGENGLEILQGYAPGD